MTRFVSILTGPVGSGKTTALVNWSAHRPSGSVAGVLAPIVDGRRAIRLVDGEETRGLEAADEASGSRVVTIGPHRFDGEVFRWAREHLFAATRRSSPAASTAAGGAAAGGATTGSDAREAAAGRWIIVDEVGPLELRGEGLEPALAEILSSARSGRGDAWSPRILLVVRDSLVDRVVGHYALGATLKAVVTTGSIWRLDELGRGPEANR